MGHCTAPQPLAASRLAKMATFLGSAVAMLVILAALTAPSSVPTASPLSGVMSTRAGLFGSTLPAFAIVSAAASEDDEDYDEFDDEDVGVDAASEFGDASTDAGIDEAAEFDDNEFDDSANEKVATAAKAGTQHVETATGSVNTDYDEDEFDDSTSDEFSDFEDSELESGRDEPAVDNEQAEDLDDSGPIDIDVSIKKPVRQPLFREMTLESNWPELVALVGLGVYLVFYVVGRARNKSIVTSLSGAFLETMKGRFEKIGDRKGNEIIAEAADEYALYGTGNPKLTSFRVGLELQHRQDIMTHFIDQYTGRLDEVEVVASFQENAGAKFFLCILPEKSEKDQRGAYEDVDFFAKAADTKTFGTLKVWSDHSDVSRAFLNEDLTQRIKDLEPYLYQIKITDQYRYQKVRDPSSWDTKKPLKLSPGLHVFAMSVRVNMASPGAKEVMQNASDLAFAILDRVAAFKIPGQARPKLEKLREEYLSVINKALSKQESVATKEKIQQKKEEKRAKLEQNPEKLEKWEAKQKKRELRRRQKTGQKIILG